MITFDQATVDSSGAFLIGELERLDQTLNLPLVGYTWTRDIQLREDVSIADDISSWTNTSFAAAGTGANPNGKNWVGKDSTAIAGVSGTTAQPASIATDGVYIVRGIMYTGDTRGQAWYMDMMCEARGAADLQSQGAMNRWG